MKECCPKAPEHFAPLLGYCDHQIQKLMEKELRQYGVSPMQCHTLTYLYKATHEVNQKMLQDFLMVKPSTVNGIVDRLEKKGFIEFRPDKTDRRCKRIYILPKGAACNETMRKTIDDSEARIVAGFSPEEKTQFILFLNRAIRNLETCPGKHLQKEEKAND